MLRSALITSAVSSALVLAWAGASRFGWVDAFLLPPPGRVLGTAAELIADGTLLHNTAISLRRVALGFALATGLAVPLGVLFGISPILRQLFEPPLEFLRQIPPLAMIPLLILWLGIGEAQKIGIIVLASFFPIFLGVIGGVGQVDPKLVEVGRSCEMGRAEIARRIVLPAALPSIVIGLRIGLGYSWRALVGAELVASSAGLGYLIVDAENLARTDIVLVGVITIGILGVIADQATRVLVRRAAPWADPVEVGGA